MRNLKFDEKPDYTYLKKIMKERFVREGYEFDYVYDWLLIPLSRRNPKLQLKIPITVDLINNEEELLKQYDESNYSKDNIEQGLSPHDMQDDYPSIQKDQDDFIQNSNKNEENMGASKQQTINKARILKPEDHMDIQLNSLPANKNNDDKNNKKKQKKDGKKKDNCLIF